MYNIYITKVKNIRPAENADRLNLCEVFGNTTVVDKSVNENDLYVYLPVDGQISQEFGEVNNLFRKKNDQGENVGGFIDPERRNIRAIRLRGNRSDGLVLPLSSLETFGDISTLKEGDIVTTFNGHVIAEKYIPRSNNSAHSHFSGNRTRKKKAPIAPLFAEHADTEQLAYNLGAFKSGDYVEITLKMHGTSQRTGYLPRLTGYKRTLWERITRKEGTPIYDYGYVSGTRRTVLEDYSGGYYGDNAFREPHSKVFEGKLHKGETVYYEVVSFTNDGTPIMGVGKVPKEAQSIYGKEMIFHYGRNEGSDIYVYRMTLTNEDGYVIDYTPDMIRYRCEQIGVKTVPVLWSGIIPDFPGATYDYTIEAGEWIKNKAEQYYDGPDPIGKTHVREGVVVRIVNRPKFCAYKHKNFLFKQISGIIVEQITDNESIKDNDILSEM